MVGDRAASPRSACVTADEEKGPFLSYRDPANRSKLWILPEAVDMTLFDPDSTSALPLSNRAGYRFLSVFKVRHGRASLVVECIYAAWYPRAERWPR